MMFRSPVCFALALLFSLPVFAQNYEDNVRLTQAQVDACRAVVAPLHLSAAELEGSCAAADDNVGRGTTATRIAAGANFAGCVRGFQRLYREHAPARTRRLGAAVGARTSPAFLMNCAYMSSAARRSVARNNSSFERCITGSIARGTRPTGLSDSIRRCAGRGGYGYDAAFGPRAAPSSVPADESESSSAGSAVEAID